MAQEPSTSPTIHAATLASGSSGAVEFGSEFDESAAIDHRLKGLDIVVRGVETKSNRRLAQKIEAAVGPPTRPQFPHTSAAGHLALPHFHQQSRSPAGHCFYETDKRKAKKRS